MAGLPVDSLVVWSVGWMVGCLAGWLVVLDRCNYRFRFSECVRARQGFLLFSFT